MVQYCDRSYCSKGTTDLPSFSQVLTWIRKQQISKWVQVGMLGGWTLGLETDSEVEWFFPDDSYVTEYFELNRKYFSKGRCGMTCRKTTALPKTSIAGRIDPCDAKMFLLLTAGIWNRQKAGPKSFGNLGWDDPSDVRQRHHVVIELVHCMPELRSTGLAQSVATSRSPKMSDVVGPI
eukprot:5502616-Amphidinium_carterae.1